MNHQVISAFHNWFVLETLMKTTNWAFLANIKFLDSEFADDFKQSITDATWQATKKDLQLLFLDQLLFELENSHISTASQLMKTITSYPFSAKDDFLKNFAAKQVELIEKKIMDAKDKRRADTSVAQAGKDLYTATQEEINLLKDILGTEDYKYTSIVDNVADEILQCGIDHFNRYKDTDTDPSGTSMALFIQAEMLAMGDYTKQRCHENTENLQEWIDNKPEREKTKGSCI